MGWLHDKFNKMTPYEKALAEHQAAIKRLEREGKYNEALQLACNPPRPEWYPQENK